MFPHQQAMASEIRSRSRVACLLSPGLGKTAATLTALADLGAWPALVVAPAQTARSVWPDEAALWEHLRNVQVTPVVGSPRGRLALLREASHVEVVSYENLFWLTEHVDLSRRYRAVVFDELSKMKAAGTKRFRRVKAAAKGIEVRVGLTGTPVGNHLLDLWGELYVIGGKDALGPTFTGFKAEYFWPVDKEQHRWELRSPDFEHAIHERARPWCWTLPPQPAVHLPEIRENPIRIPVPPAAAKAAAELKRELATMLDSGEEIEALTAGARATKLRQIAGGAVYGEGAAWAHVHDAKLRALDDLLDELQGEPVLIFYWYRHERERILARLARRGAVHATTDHPGWVRAWNARELEAVVAHPQSAGHGLNLQAGGHTVIWYSLPWSRELWRQGNGRLARPGQTSTWVLAHLLLCGEADEAVLRALGRKARTEEALIDALLRP
jgi:hypothetical protein